MVKLKLSLLVMLLILSIYLSYSATVIGALDPHGGDFSAFYFAASVVLNPDLPNSNIYDRNAADSFLSVAKIKNAEISEPMPFIYSPFAAYMISPIALASLEKSRIVFNFSCLVVYILIIFIILRIVQANTNEQILCLSLTLMWFPFLLNQSVSQINVILFSFIGLSFYAAVKNYPYISGIILGIAALFKIYPLIIALVIGVKNYRILAATLVVFGLGLLVPGSSGWFAMLKDVSSFIYGNLASDTYKLLGRELFAAFVLIVAIITASTVYRARNQHMSIVFSFAIASAFLVLPSINFPMLTVLCLRYICTMTKFNYSYNCPIVLSIALVTMGSQDPNISAGLFVLWLTLAIWMFRNTTPKTESVNITL